MGWSSRSVLAAAFSAHHNDARRVTAGQQRAARVAAVLLWSLGLGAGCDHDAPDEPFAHPALQGVELDLLEAIERAEALHPAGVTVEAEFARQDGIPIYEVDLLDASEVYEISIDARDGAVLDMLTDPEDLPEAEAAAAALAASSVSLGDALERAELETGGFPIKVEVEDGQAIEVVVIVEQEVISLTVSLEDGSIRETGA